MLVGRVILTALIAVFAAAAVANGVDRLSAGSPGLERMVPVPFRAQADRSAASTAFDRKDGAAALASARDAVDTDPVDPDATAWLGSALSLIGRDEDAQRTFRIAARFGWRNVETQAYWYSVALQAGDYEVAAERLDALLRVHPRLVDQPDLLKPMESDPTALKALAARLKLLPPWMEDYLDVAADAPADVIDRRLAAISAVASSGVPIGCDLVGDFTKTLVDTGRRHDAETLWNRSCPTMKVSGLIADTTFAQVLNTTSPSPFSWRVIASGNLSLTQVPGNNGSHTLTIENSAPGTRLALLQTVAFPPGVYRFQVKQSAQGTSAGGKLYISWGCNGKPPFPDTQSGDLLGAGQEIRVTDCDRQQIGLWVGRGVPVQLQSITFAKIG